MTGGRENSSSSDGYPLRVSENSSESMKDRPEHFSNMSWVFLMVGSQL